jgi:uncharacterized protein YmfQ (DUF2313 family)
VFCLPEAVLALALLPSTTYDGEWPEEGRNKSDWCRSVSGRIYLKKQEAKMKLERIFLSIAIGGMLISVPMTVPARAADDHSKYSDRDHMKSSKNDKERLEQMLKSGEEKGFYRRELEKAGWSITSVNYDKPDYLEYEIVKGDQSYEVQIDMDKNSHKASKVDVVTNVWKTDATEQALKNGKKVEYPSRTTANASRYSDRDRMKSAKNQEERLEQALKTGEEKPFYKRELDKMGWKITSVNYDKPDYTEYEIVKNDSTYEVQIDFDKNSHKATKVDVTTNAWKAEATENALKQYHEHAKR